MLTLKDLWYLLDFGLERVELAQASEKGVDFFFFFIYHYLFLSPKDIKRTIARQSGKVFNRQKDR